MGDPLGVPLGNPLGNPLGIFGARVDFPEKNLLVPGKSVGLIWTPWAAELSQKMLFQAAAGGKCTLCTPCARLVHALGTPWARLVHALRTPCARLVHAKGGGGVTTNFPVDQRRCRCWPTPTPLLTGHILWVGALRPGTVGSHCLAMLPRSNTSCCGAPTILRAALHGRRGRRAACTCTGTPVASQRL